MVVVEDRGVRAELPLPIAGIISDAPLAEVVEASRGCIDAAAKLGCTLASPFQTMAFLALSVIPSLKLTDQGLVDVDRFELVSAPGVSASVCQRLRRRHGRRRAPSTSRLGAGRGRRRRGRRRRARAGGRAADRPAAAPSSRRGSSTPTTTCTRPLRAPGRRRPTSSPGCGRSTPVWARIDAEAEHAAARHGLAELALSGCTTVFDHHYVFPARARRPRSRPRWHAARRARRVGSSPSRGSMDLGESDGGLPPDDLVEDPDAVARRDRAGCAARPDAAQLVVAPCSPFSVTGRLMRGVGGAAPPARPAAAHAPRRDGRGGGVLPRARIGCRPVEYLEQLGWLDGDVWCAHCVHLDDGDIARFAETGTGVAHCPTSNLRLGAGVAPIRGMLDAGVRVGLGVDGSASNERGDLAASRSSRRCSWRAAEAAPRRMTARDALRLGTRGGAAVLGRDDLGSLEPGRSADLAVWRTDGLELGGAEDPVAGLILSGPHRVDRLVVSGEDVVREGRLVRADEEAISQEHRRQAEKFTE